MRMGLESDQYFMLIGGVEETIISTLRDVISKGMGLNRGCNIVLLYF